MNKSKGFTIIELIVVIAIIAVLAGIVLVNVTQYINRGKDAAAQGNLATMMTNGAVYFDEHSDYKDFITNNDVSSLTADANDPGDCSKGGNSGFITPCQALTNGGYEVKAYCSDGTAAKSCHANGVTNWCAQITLKTDAKTYCVDSNGSKKIDGTCSATTGKCS